MSKTPSLGVRVRPAVKAALQRAAEADVRTLSSMVEKILTDWLVKEGLLGPEKPAPRKRGSRP